MPEQYSTNTESVERDSEEERRRKKDLQRLKHCFEMKKWRERDTYKKWLAKEMIRRRKNRAK